MLGMFRDIKEVHLAYFVGPMRTEIGAVVKEIIGVRKLMCSAL